MKNTVLFLSIAVITLAAVGASAQVSANADYQEAKVCYDDIKVTSSKAKSRAPWEKCIALFDGVAKNFPNTLEAAKSIYSSARLHRELYEKLRDKKDLDKAIEGYNRVVSEFPDNELADDALYQIARLRHDPLKDDEKARKAYAYLIENYPASDMAPLAKQELADLDSRAVKPVDSEDDDDEGSDIEDSAKAAKAAAPAAKPAFSNDVAGRFNVAALRSVNVEDGAGATVVRFKFTSPVAYSLKFAEQGNRTGSPPKLNVLFTYAVAGGDISKDIPVSSPYLERVKLAKGILSSGTSAVFKMAPDSRYDIEANGSEIAFRFASVHDAPEKKGALAVRAGKGAKNAGDAVKKKTP